AASGPGATRQRHGATHARLPGAPGRGGAGAAGTMNTTVIIPALNEAGAIGALVAAALAVPVKLAGLVEQAGPVDEVLVVDNGSRADTAAAARGAGARVVIEPRRGYGYACAAGAAAAAPEAEALVFLDGDHSFTPAEMPRLLAPLRSGQAD